VECAQAAPLSLRRIDYDRPVDLADALSPRGSPAISIQFLALRAGLQQRAPTSLEILARSQPLPADTWTPAGPDPAPERRGSWVKLYSKQMPTAMILQISYYLKRLP